MAAVGAIVATTLTVPPRFVVSKVTLAWTSTAGGAVSGIPVAVPPGRLVRVVTIQGAGGVQPTAYTLTLLDDDGIDALNSLGTARSTTVAEQLVPLIGTYMPIPVFGNLSLTIAGAGAAKQGTVQLYITT